jgi:hypothetical protein
VVFAFANTILLQSTDNHLNTYTMYKKISYK